MNIITTAQALEAINKRLRRPITRQAFHRSIVPLMIERQDAQAMGNMIIIDGEWLPAWASYIADRQRRIDAGELPAKSPYSIADMEDHFHNGD